MKNCLLTIIFISSVQLIGGLSFAGDIYQLDIREVLILIEKHPHVYEGIPATFSDSVEYTTIYKNPHNFLHKILEALADPNVSENQKFIAINAMSRLSLQDRIYFSKQLVKLKQDNLINADICINGIFPYLNCSTIIPESYKNEELRKLLLEIRALDWVDDNRKEYIDDVLSGKMYYLVLWRKIQGRY